jgi:hypothetical protein
MAAASAKPFGAAPSDYEGLQLKGTMATAKDPFKIMNRFLSEQTIANSHMIDVREKFDNYNNTAPKTASAYGFFGTQAYKDAGENYHKNYKAYKTLTKGL